MASFPAWKLGPDIPSVKAVDLYGSIVLPQLENGPKSLDELGVPRYAVAHLERAGLVRMRTVTQRTPRATFAIQTWYRTDCPPDCDHLDLAILDAIERHYA